jgi:hypothetical protein
MKLCLLELNGRFGTILSFEGADLNVLCHSNRRRISKLCPPITLPLSRRHVTALHIPIIVRAFPAVETISTQGRNAA